MKPGDIFDYSYLWHRQAGAGEESGRKTRPCCLAVVSRRDPAKLFLFPLTWQLPEAGRPAYAFTEFESKRSGLYHPAWIILDEYNVASAEYVTDFGDLRPRGSLPPATLRTVLDRLRALQASSALRGVKRDAE